MVEENGLQFSLPTELGSESGNFGFFGNKKYNYFSLNGEESFRGKNQNSCLDRKNGGVKSTSFRYRPSVGVKRGILTSSVTTTAIHFRSRTLNPFEDSIVIRIWTKKL